MGGPRTGPGDRARGSASRSAWRATRPGPACSSRVRSGVAVAVDYGHRGGERPARGHPHGIPGGVCGRARARRELRPDRPRRHGQPRPRRARRPANGAARARRARPRPRRSSWPPRARRPTCEALSHVVRRGVADRPRRVRRLLVGAQARGLTTSRSKPRSTKVGRRTRLDDLAGRGTGAAGSAARSAAPAGPAARRCRSGCRRRTPGAGWARGSGRTGRGRRRRPGRGWPRRAGRPPSRPARGAMPATSAGSLAVRSNRCSGESWRRNSSARRATAAASSTSTAGRGSAVSQECRPLPNPLTLASCPALRSSTAVATSSRAESRSLPSRACDEVGEQVVAGVARAGRRRAPRRRRRTRRWPRAPAPPAAGVRSTSYILHDRLRPGAQRRPVGLGHTQQLGDDEDGQRLGIRRPGRRRARCRHPARSGRAGRLASCSIRGASRATCPRPKAPATRRRSRVCLGGSLSRIESACSQLNVSQSDCGVRGRNTRPSRRSRSTAPQASWLVATQMPRPLCQATGAAARRRGQVRVGVGDDGGVGEVEEVGGVDGRAAVGATSAACPTGAGFVRRSAGRHTGAAAADREGPPVPHDEHTRRDRRRPLRGLRPRR